MIKNIKIQQTFLSKNMLKERVRTTLTSLDSCLKKSLKTILISL